MKGAPSTSSRSGSAVVPGVVVCDRVTTLAVAGPERRTAARPGVAEASVEPDHMPVWDEARERSRTIWCPPRCRICRSERQRRDRARDSSRPRSATTAFSWARQQKRSRLGWSASRLRRPNGASAALSSLSGAQEIFEAVTPPPEKGSATLAPATRFSRGARPTTLGVRQTSAGDCQISAGDCQMRTREFALSLTYH
jgi:hypothetical protein